MVRRSLQSQVESLIQFRDDFLAGAYPQRTALGPGSVSKTFIKSKSISASMLDVSELASVATNTGALTVTGDLLAGSGGTRMGYSPTSGLYLGNENSSLAPFSVTPAGALKSTSATITGSITASTLSANGSGSIAGWTIDSAKLSQGNVGIGASGSYRIWSGNLSSPSLADFSVDNSGNVKAAAGEIGPWDLSSSALSLDSGGVGLGQSGGIRIWAGSSSPSSAPFRVSSTGGFVSTSATVQGAVTATSGSFTGSITTSNLDANGGNIGGLTIDGTLSFGIGGQISWDSGGSYITSGAIQLNAPSSVLRFRSGSSGPYGVVGAAIAGGVAAAQVSAITSGGSLGARFVAGSNGTASIETGSGSVPVFSYSGSDVLISSRNSGEVQFAVNGSVHTRIDGAGRFIVTDNIFPDNQIHRYVSDNGTTIGFGGVPTSGSAGALEAYATININGTSYKVALYAL